MSLFFFLCFFFFFFYYSILGLGFSDFTSPSLYLVNTHEITNRRLADSPCPMNFTILSNFVQQSKRLKIQSSTECRYILQGLRLVQSDYLKASGFFLPPLNSSESCWDTYQTLVREFLPKFDIRSACGFQTSWISQGCMNITSRSEFETLIPDTLLQDVYRSCNQSLEDNSPCASCTTSLSRVQASYLPGPEVGNVTECSMYPSIYAAALVNQLGPLDNGTAKCLFSLDLSGTASSNKKRKGVVIGVTIGFTVGLLGVIGGLWFLLRRYKKGKRKKQVKIVTRTFSGLESIGASTTLVRYTFDEIKRATRNFSRENIIGRGGYGNVYKGILPNGSEVALKRFKNCSAAGDASFAHEVEVIASVRHVNLVALRGYCTATTTYEGHQRIIVCDLMQNGSLHDHLFGSVQKKLSWSIRQKIALGMARGLAYLHYGAQPAIIHRDIKAGNILLDENFEVKVADFGLAKFTPEGMTHLSTRVAGTLGYVAPEYALYGQLTERSDVYSFGVVLLELLSGRKALISTSENQTSLLTDWAWSLVRRGRTLDVKEEGMPELGPPEIMEKYIMIGVLCSHPQLYARPTMDQIVKIMETDLPVPSIPDRPVSIVAEISDIERSASSSGSGYLSSSTGYQAFTSEGDNQSFNKRQRG
ncbi:Protein kinase domain [Macleaya cordata]|uniref:non-specific serine/threonine protein kinase n=1 Tax=Macleaya cordata TaxID=56857 RepID=A0A200Q1S8_MACCD|nr:Protein kinase domain [Macleaya cordata]